MFPVLLGHRGHLAYFVHAELIGVIDYLAAACSAPLLSVRPLR
jgi:hypothetical protein